MEHICRVYATRRHLRVFISKSAMMSTTFTTGFVSHSNSVGAGSCFTGRTIYLLLNLETVRQFVLSVTVTRKPFLQHVFLSLSSWRSRNSGRAAVCVFNCISGLVKAQQAGSAFQGEAGSAPLLKASHSAIFSSNKSQVSLGDGHLTGSFISLSIHSVSLYISHIHILSMLLEIERLYCIISFFFSLGMSFMNSELTRPNKELIW